MSIDKQYLREVAKQATGAHERINAISADDIFDISLHHDGAQLDADITDLNSFNEAANPATVLELLDELEAAEKRIAELETREVVLPSTQDVHPLGPQSAKIFCEFHRSIVNRCADEIRKVGVKVSIKGN